MRRSDRVILRLLKRLRLFCSAGMQGSTYPRRPGFEEANNSNMEPGVVHGLSLAGPRQDSGDRRPVPNESSYTLGGAFNAEPYEVTTLRCNIEKFFQIHGLSVMAPSSKRCDSSIAYQPSIKELGA